MRELPVDMLVPLDGFLPAAFLQRLAQPRLTRFPAVIASQSATPGNYAAFSFRATATDRGPPTARGRRHLPAPNSSHPSDHPKCPSPRITLTMKPEPTPAHLHRNPDATCATA